MRVASVVALLLSFYLVHGQEDGTGLGYLQTFSAFAHEDVVASNSNTRGRMAAGRNVNLENYSVGNALTFQCKRTDLLVGNELTFIDGEVERGTITYRGQISLTDVGLGCPTSKSNSQTVNFDDVFTQLNSTAKNFQDARKTGITTTSGSSITFRGLLANNIFLTDTATLSSATNIFIDLPINASATIVVEGRQVSISSAGVTLSDTTDVQRILWSMYEAVHVTVSNIDFKGSILAPSATINVASGSISGSVAAKSIFGEASIEYFPYLPPNSNCSCIPCPPLWTLPPFSLFIFDSVSMSETQDSGRLAAGGHVSLQSFSIGNDLPMFPTVTNSTVVGGNFEFTSGSINGGNIIVAGTATLTDVSVAYEVYQNTPVSVDFAGQAKNLTFNTIYFSKLISNGQVSSLYGTLTLSSVDTGLNIFTLTSSQFTEAYVVSISCPETSWAIINIPDENAEMNGISVELEGITANRIIFNFYEASTLNIENVSVEGSVLAPMADVTFPSGNINGNLVGNSIRGKGATTKNLPLPLKPPCPPCLCVDVE